MKMKAKSVRVVVCALCAVMALSIAGHGQSTRGTFKLPTETQWGKLVLVPGQYEFTVTDALAGKIISVRSIETGWSGMIMASDASPMTPSSETKLLLTKSEAGTYVRSLYLGDAGVTLNYQPPKAVKIARVPTQPTATVASASGAQ
jgi:hypothetical protein